MKKQVFGQQISKQSNFNDFMQKVDENTVLNNLSTFATSIIALNSLYERYAVISSFKNIVKNASEAILLENKRIAKIDDIFSIMFSELKDILKTQTSLIKKDIAGISKDIKSDINQLIELKNLELIGTIVSDLTQSQEFFTQSETMLLLFLAYDIKNIPNKPKYLCEYKDMNKGNSSDYTPSIEAIEMFEQNYKCLQIHTLITKIINDETTIETIENCIKEGQPIDVFNIITGPKKNNDKERPPKEVKSVTNAEKAQHFHFYTEKSIKLNNEKTALSLDLANRIISAGILAMGLAEKSIHKDITIIDDLYNIANYKASNKDKRNILSDIITLKKEYSLLKKELNNCDDETKHRVFNMVQKKETELEKQKLKAKKIAISINETSSNILPNTLSTAEFMSVFPPHNEIFYYTNIILKTITKQKNKQGTKAPVQDATVLKAANRIQFQRTKE